MDLMAAIEGAAHSTRCFGKSWLLKSSGQSCDYSAVPGSLSRSAALSLGNESFTLPPSHHYWGLTFQSHLVFHPSDDI